ncbi:hypothetical protein ABB37_00130 [Leptomonas pyrrhocoris]|uniref:Uncharacterized protein n=1 Tax=Leptomonas pyrrhocoris TaxID=157538 RepID=A0A0M9GA47_LEPPY|nr:hypothetical protein ABB37_00130 [Leptomonas pyrrhocoris]XP_015664216.1 hypothetical protein ABB37_00130 [Leptomonas pyrrhocoris]KPA85776.1 hypothetical protein ABB37_00130 [Leptomonas pyrrhocoris]KPA85777.1 hypothetical protein ABB37_00130 [Leptomonas pyrrhocoris]|eukprot:XP_015664215.1 hypothetical protein ABB37_00130 [Leptomonas pyrrhocoris]
MSAGDRPAAVANETASPRLRGSSHLHESHHRNEDSNEWRGRAAPQLPMRRPCPSAPQHRHWNQTPPAKRDSSGSSSSSSASVPRAAAIPLVTSTIVSAARAAADMTAEREPCLKNLLPVASPCALLARSTDAAGRTHIVTHATTVCNGNNDREREAEIEDTVPSLSVVGVADTKPAPGSSLTHSPPLGADKEAENADASPRSADATTDGRPEKLVQRNLDHAGHSGLHYSFTTGQEEATNKAAATCAKSSTDVVAPSHVHSPSAPPVPLSLTNTPVVLRMQAPQQLVKPFREANAPDKAELSPPPIVSRNAADGGANGAEARPRWPPNVPNTKKPMPNAVKSGPRAVQRASVHMPAPSQAKESLPATPGSAQSALSPNDPFVDWKHSVVSHSCSLTRLMQRHQQEGWKDELRNVLQQDADAWVQQVYEEQCLLQAHLTFTQAKVAELTREVQLLRGEELEDHTISSQLPDGKAPPRDLETEALAPDGSADADLAVTPDGVADQQHGCDKKLDDHPTGLTCPPAYKLEMETYIHSLEAHTRALHDENQQLQLRLDRRTAQLASAQQRYEQNYSLLLHEQSVLEADYQKVAEDVEEVVGMLVAARAAEQAALRRLSEYEVALDEAEMRVKKMEAQQLQQQLHLQLGDNEERAGKAPVARSSSQAQWPCSRLCLAQQPSTSDSAFYSVVEVNDPDGAATSTATSTPPLVSAVDGGPLTLPLRSVSEEREEGTILLSHSSTPMRHTPSLPVPLPSPARPSSETPQRARSVNFAVCGGAAPSPSSTSISFSDGSFPAAASSSHTARTPSVLTAASPDVAGSKGEDASASVPHIQAKSKSRLLTPLASSLAALLTPGSVAARRRSSSNGSTTPALLRDGCVNFAKDIHGSPSEQELLRFKCTLLEFELQSKEKMHQEEKKKWESAVHNAEAVNTAMGEVEARVRQATASSNRVEGLLHEMNRVWCTSFALEDEGDSEDEDLQEKVREYSPLAVMDEEWQLRRRSSRISVASVYNLPRQSSLEGAADRGSRRLPEFAGSGREFFGTEKRAAF